MINYTIRPILWLHKKDKHGLHPLKIAVTIERRVSYYKTPFKLKETQWAGEIIKYENAKIANATLRKQMTEIENNILSRQMAGEKVTAQSLKKSNKKSLRVFAIEVKGNNKHTLKELNRIDRLYKDILLIDITPELLRKYEAHERARGMSQNTINTTFKWLRRILRQAWKEKLILSNPFESYAVPRYQQTDRTYLTDEEKQRMLEKAKPDYPFYNTLCYSLLSCYTSFRHQDWKRFNASRIEGDHVKLRATKNNQLVVLPIGPTLRGIIKKVLKLPPPFSLEQCNRELKIIAKDCGIKKNLTCHVMRHSFGYMCAKNRLPRSVTAELMGISERVVSVYYHLEGTDISEQAAVLKTI